MERIACIHVPQWPIQRLIGQRPELRFQHVVLFHQHPQRGQIVVAVSPRAALQGIRPGMPVTEAKSLLRRATPGKPVARESFYLLPYEAGVDREALTAIARQLDTFSPLIGIDPQEPSASLLLDLTGLGKLFGDEATLLRGVREVLQGQGYVVEASIASTVGAAWALAHYGMKGGDGWEEASPLIATDFDWRTFDPLPTTALRIEAGVCETLQQLGLTTIGALRQIPAASLTARFGDVIARRLHQLSGEQPETFQAVPRALAYHAEQVLDFPLRDQTTVLVVIERLLERVCRELQRVRQGALAWHIRLWRAEAKPLPLRVGLFQASSHVAQIMPLVRMQLEQHAEFDGLNHPIEEVAVSAESCVLLVERQGELFDEQPRTNETALGELLNRLAIRLGEDRVLSAACVSGAQPERAVEYRPLVGPRSVRPRRSTQRLTGDVLQRPARLLSKPLELTPLITAEHSQRSRSAVFEMPSGFEWRGHSFQVHRSWGPERIETGWWQGRTVRRDYWRIETTNGSQFWIFRDLRSRKWFLHGGF
jgi:protein ImuB